MNKITKIEVQKNNKNRVNIYVNDEYAFSCDAELVYTHRLKVNEELDLKNMEKVADEDNYIKAKRDALRILEKTYKTEKEIYNKLKLKGYTEGIIERVIKFLESYNFVDDFKYVNAYVNDKISTQGKKKIYYALSSKGVNEEIIRSKLEAIDDNSEYEGAKKLALKKLNLISKKESENSKIRLKLSQYLSSRGYGWEMIQRVIKDILNSEELDL